MTRTAPIEKDAYRKIVRIGTVDVGNTQPANLYCNIRIKSEGELSITGVEGPRRNGDCAGACGQIIMHEWEIVDYAPGWDAERVTEFRDIWERWHLNHMKAGTPRQMEHLRTLRERGERYTYNKDQSAYCWACERLSEVGLLEDAGYRYGTSWLKEPLPEHVVSWLKALPETDREPAWV